MRFVPAAATSRIVTIRFAWICLIVLLAGCQRTVFESAPTTAQACDQELAGRWLSEADAGSQPGEIEIRVDRSCGLIVTERKPDGPKRSQPTRLHNAQIGGVNYLWVDATWANENFDVERNEMDQEGDVYIVAYRIRRGVLQLAAPPHRDIAHLVLDKKIRGEVLMREDDLTVRVSGGPDVVLAAIQHQRMFRFSQHLRFQRGEGGGSP
jgi:hypothetical protein